MPARVNIGRMANADLDAALRWRAERTPAAARRWMDGLLRAIQRLATSPSRHELAPEANPPHRVVHQMLYGKRRNVFRVLYEVHGDVVHVIRVRHAAQDDLAPDELPPT